MNPNRSVLEGEIYKKAYSLDNIEIFDDPTVANGLCAIFFHRPDCIIQIQKMHLKKVFLMLIIMNGKR